MNLVSEASHKLDILAGYLEELGGYRVASLVEFEQSGATRRATERMVQLVVEVAFDINQRLLSLDGRRPATSYYTSFSPLVDMGLISDEALRQIADIVGLRNRIVHDYEHPDAEAVYLAVPKTLDNFVAYARAVRRKLGEAEPDTH